MISVDELRDNHWDQLPQWYCDLNCYRKPEGFPVELGVVDRAHHENPVFKQAFNAVSLAIGEERASLSWWVIELGRTEGEWAVWWADRKSNGMRT